LSRDLGGARVEDVHEHALALPHTKGLSVSEQAPVDREELAADFEALVYLIGLPVRVRSELLQLGEGLASEHVHRVYDRALRRQRIAKRMAPR
jgi:hypothetical protein